MRPIVSREVWEIFGLQQVIKSQKTTKQQTQPMQGGRSLQSVTPEKMSSVAYFSSPQSDEARPQQIVSTELHRG